MAKTNIEMQTKENVLSLLKNKGYSPKYMQDGEQEQIDCIIGGTSFAIFYEINDCVIGYCIIFEPNEPITDTGYEDIVKLFSKEKTPFEDCIKDEFGAIHLYGEIYAENCLEEFVNSIIETIEKKDGIVAKLKEISYIWED